MSQGQADIEHLYDRYGASMYRYALVLLANPGAAEDVVQSMFLTLLQRRHEILNESHYLRRAVRNECFSMLRGKQKLEVPMKPLLEPISKSEVSNEDRLALEQAIRELPPEQREAIHLHVFEGLTFQEIANATELSINTITARYRYAVTKLRRELQASGSSSGRWVRKSSGGD